MATAAQYLPLTLLVLYPSACTTGEHEPSTPPLLGPGGAGTEDEACSPRFGHAYVLDRLGLLPAGEGLDLDGDGRPDNALGVLADVFNPGWQSSIESGEAIFLWDFAGWTGPPARSASDLRLSFYIGFDADDEAKNNLRGSGTFLVSSQQFDVACQSLSQVDYATLVDGAVTTEVSLWELHQPSLGTVTVADFRTEFRFAADFASLEGRAGGTFTLCGLSVAPFHGATGSKLDAIVNGLALQADIDRDGDGIERVEGDGESVTRCIDGDGTVIERADCPCDPRIADGYSAAFRGSGVPARIVGLFDAE